MTSKEKKGLEQWMNLHTGSAEESNMMKRLWEATGSYKSGFQPDVNKGFSRFKAKTGQSGATVATLKPRFIWLKVAASVAVLVFVVFLFKNLMDASGNMDNITAEKGVSKSFLLSDGSSVSLNENTSLEFPDNFSGAERRVRLTGEAFFKVAKDAAHPFIVETPQVEVQVLGTSFNVREYPGEGMTEVFVKTGKVAVTSKTTGEQYVLLPGDKLTFETATSVAVKTKDSSGNSIAWKNGRLVFDEKPIDEILKSVERLHHVHFAFENEDLHDCTFNITLDASRLKDVLNSFELACPGISISPAGRGEYSVSGKCCE
jgi:transmembrane sensor